MSLVHERDRVHERYDRRGYGWSYRGPNPRQVSVFATELDTLLTYVSARTCVFSVCMILFVRVTIRRKYPVPTS
jgi:cobalamin biosynthesis protein CobD/CbiB